MFVGSKNSKYIQRCLGWKGYCVLGSIGVTFHELSHLIIAVIFRHKITEVRLFRPSQSRIDGTLGYVDHTWKEKSVYQRIGNFFIGTAPMLFGAGLLFLVLRIAYPSSFIDVAEISEIPDALIYAFSNMFTSSSLLSVWTLIVLLVIVFICPYMNMSGADIKGAVSGVITLILLSLLLTIVSLVIPADIMTQIQGSLNTFIAYYSFALLLGLVVNIIMTICFALVSLVKK